ncbi:uncharacterized protein LOC128187089 isoform X35 [Crassostrea angulata]|uniref:uncharacterized protein LOC128187089 isoform X35 n=1 Tax=Magallana angulata TaxID=2784310 RepID=UPI0022B1B4E8|nr:uncharacterized protein LOC128187089 isoform X35 [Crassostrea angulata]
MSYEQNVKPWSGMYMQQTTYKHDYNPAGGISPRNRQTNYPYGADAPKADIPGPYNNFRPRYGDPLPQHIRDQRIKRGEEWIGGRRYDEPMTDRGQYYERERGRDLSPYRYQDRGRNGSPERYYDRGRDNGRGRDFDRRRDESPGKFREWDRDRNGYNGYNDRYSRLFRDKFKYLDLYERPAQPMIDSYADHRKMTDRTTYKDYGEFLQEKIKLDELKKQPVEYPAANLRDHLTHRETYREQMHGPEMVRKPYNSQDKLLERERQLEAQIRREMEKIELHDGNFKPWARDAKNPTHHVPKSTNSGVYLFIRTNKLAKADVVKALQEGRSVLANSYGQLKGIATNREIQLLEGQEGWNIRANMTRTGDYWLERSQDSTVIDDMILVIWFPTFNDAEKWVISERKFKTPSFPEPYGSDVMILPLNDSQPQERIAYTYITTEYPRQLDPVMFRENFVPKIKEVLYKHGNDGFFIQSVGAKVIRGHWVKPSSLITTIRFNTRQDALNFFLDPEYKQIRLEISRRIEQLPVYMNWFKPVSFMFTLDKYV